jgi:hypothetical protein
MAPLMSETSGEIVAPNTLALPREDSGGRQNTDTGLAV